MIHNNKQNTCIKELAQSHKATPRLLSIVNVVEWQQNHFETIIGVFIRIVIMKWREEKNKIRVRANRVCVAYTRNGHQTEET